MSPILIGTKEVQEHLGCTQRYAIQLMHMWEWHGQVYRIGRRLKVNKAYFESWLDAQKTKEALLK